jgi:4,5-dihydroxyphthalate decarboxylase
MTAESPAATWHALVGDHPTTRLLRRGALGSPLFRLEFADVAVPHTAFKRVVRQLEFDVAELALMTFLMAKALGKPLVLLPVVVLARNPLWNLVCHGRRPLTPGELSGTRIGVRAYTTTTAAWIRGVLAEYFAFDADRVEWITLEESHVAEFADPHTVRRARAGSQLAAMLRAGEIDAAITDPDPGDPEIVSVVSDSARVFDDWQRRHGAMTINHMIVVRQSLTTSHPAAVRDLIRLFDESQRASGLPLADSTPLPAGIDALRKSLEIAIEYATSQRLIERPLRVDDLFDETTAGARVEGLCRERSH